MKLKLEQLEYQEKAIQSVVSVFKGQIKNSFDNSTNEGIKYNYLSLLDDDITQNKKAILKENGIPEQTASLSKDNDLCIEMETGTGKTLVYLKTIFELFKTYAFTKFIIVVPSVPVKEGIISTFETFKVILSMFNTYWNTLTVSCYCILLAERAYVYP